MKKILNLRNGRRMDWEEFLQETPIEGHDFQIIFPIKGVELFRGPMGAILRVEDEVLFYPEWIAFKHRGLPPTILIIPIGQQAPSVHLLRSRPVQLPDTTIVIVGYDGTPMSCFHPRGNNLTMKELFGYAYLT